MRVKKTCVNTGNGGREESTLFNRSVWNICVDQLKNQQSPASHSICINNKHMKLFSALDRLQCMEFLIVILLGINLDFSSTREIIFPIIGLHHERKQQKLNYEYVEKNNEEFRSNTKKNIDNQGKNITVHID